MSYAYRSAKVTRGGRRPQSRGGWKSSQPTRQHIDINRFIQVATPVTADTYTPKNSFKDFSLHPTLQANLDAKGYTEPSPIQDQAIPEALTGKDIIGIASTGTGKTAAFAVPILQHLINDRQSAALIVAPTRELAEQIDQEFRALGRGTGLTGAILIGGTGMGSQLRDLRHSPRVVIGTPGRIKDHLQRGTLKLQNFNLVVLDEVDRMLDMGFVNDVTSILSHLSDKRQSYFFSATMDAKIRKLIQTFAKDPYTVSLKPSLSSENVHQDVIHYQGNTERMEKLHDLLIGNDTLKAIVFDETQRGVERLHNDLTKRGFMTESLHGGKSQGQRQRALSRFKSSEVNILVATDVAARGIDVADITHVINYSLPKEYDDYIHRIGRTGRAGKIGYAFTFVTN